MDEDKSCQMSTQNKNHKALMMTLNTTKLIKKNKTDCREQQAKKKLY